MTGDIRAIRLAGQGLSASSFDTPHDVVHALGAVQAQDYFASLWALGVRLPGATDGAIEEAIVAGEIIRTWPLRGTLHLVCAEDVRWLLQHLAPRVIASIRGRYRQLELEESDFHRAARVAESVLQGGKRLTRPAFSRRLEEAGISVAGQRGIHIIGRLALQGVICLGPREGRQHTVVLLDEWVRPGPELDPDEALAELACRYFGGHGPATVRDFAWWSGLPLGVARRAVDIAGSRLAALSVDGAEFRIAAESNRSTGAPSGCQLLPAFDEYLVGYKDRRAVLDPADSRAVNNGGGLLAPTVVIDGRVVGTWKRVLSAKGSVLVTVSPFAAFSRHDAEAVEDAATRYASFLGLPLTLTIADA